MDIVWAESARRDFDNAIAFIEAESPAAAEKVSPRILAAVTLLERFAEITPASRTHHLLRQMVVPRTPYLVIYRIQSRRIEIRAVIHAKQRRRKYAHSSSSRFRSRAT